MALAPLSLSKSDASIEERTSHSLFSPMVPIAAPLRSVSDPTAPADKDAVREPASKPAASIVVVSVDPVYSPPAHSGGASSPKLPSSPQ